MNAKLCAHRGMSKNFPENTMPAFEAMLDAGISYLECDLCLTKDQEIIIHHDAELGRTSNGHGPVHDHLLADVQQLDAGSWKNQVFAGTHIPSLKELLAWAMPRKITCNLELKIHGQSQRQVMLEQLQKTCEDTPDELLVYSSFDVPLLHEFRKRDARARIIPIYETIGDHLLSDAQKLEAKTIHVNGHLLCEEDAKNITKQGLEIGCYTINEPDLAKKLTSWGVNIMISDCPDELGAPAS